MSNDAETVPFPTIDHTAGGISPPPVLGASPGSVHGPATELVFKPGTAIDFTKVDLKQLALSRFGSWRAGALALVERYRDVVFDLSTTKGYEQLTKAIAEVRAPRYLAQNVTKDSKAELAAVSAAVGAELEEVKRVLSPTEERLVGLKDAHDAKVKEAKEIAAKAAAQRKQVHRDGIATIADYVNQCLGKPSAKLAQVIAYVEGLDTTEAAFEEFAAEATATRDKALDSIRRMHQSAIGREQEEAARIERERQLDEERAALAQQRADTEAQQQRMQMWASQIQGIQQQVTIAQLGRQGVRSGGTLECIEVTLAETRAWVVDEENFGPMLALAKAAKATAIAAIEALREAKVAELALAPRVTPEPPKTAAEAVGELLPAAVAPVLQPPPENAIRLVVPQQRRDDVPEVEVPVRYLAVGDIQRRLKGLNISGQFIETVLGVAHSQPAPGMKPQGTYFREDQFAEICTKLATLAREAAFGPGAEER